MYKERMQVELKDLKEKVKALGLFIYGNDIYGTLSGEKQNLMNYQLDYMKSYVDTLEARIKLEED